MGELLLLLAGIAILGGSLYYLCNRLHNQAVHQAIQKHIVDTGHKEYEFENNVWITEERVISDLPICFCEECGLRIYPILK